MRHYVIYESLISVNILIVPGTKKNRWLMLQEIIHNADYIHWHINQWSMIIIYAMIIQMNL